MSTNLNSVSLGRRSLIGIRCLAATALAVSGYLSWITLTHGTVAACSDASSHIACDHVLRSPWSRWLGIPVSLFGFAVYFLILLLSGLVTSSGTNERSTEKARRGPDSSLGILVGLATIASGSAFWFLGLQVFVIGRFCLYCIAVHVCGIAIAVILVANRWSERDGATSSAHIAVLQSAIGSVGSESTGTRRVNDKHRHILPVAVAIVGLVVLVSGQMFFPAKTFEVGDAAEILDGNSNDIFSNFNAKVSDDGQSRKGITTPDLSETAERSAHSSTENEASDLRQNSQQSTVPTPAAQSETTATYNSTATRDISFLKGKFVVDLYRHGLLGSPQADHVIVELVDYTCKDCRRLHQYFKQVRTEYGDTLAIIVLPVPLETSCNPHIKHTHRSHVGACKYARLALAVLEIDRDVFSEFHEWLMEPEYPPSLQAAQRKAVEMLDEQRLQRAIHGEGVKKRLDAHIRLFRRVGRFPAMIIRDEIVIGVPKSAADLSDVLRKRLGPIDYSL